MPILIFALLFLSGCTPVDEQFERHLNRYAQAETSEELSGLLAGAALSDAISARAYLLDLGWSQKGHGVFSQTKLVESDRVQACLDISEVGFVSSDGEQVEVDREQERFLMSALFQNGKIVQIREVGLC